MKTSWQTETGRLESRWFDAEPSLRHEEPWFKEASHSKDRSALPVIPDFASHSPLGSGEWFVPWNVRWGLPART
jgi:hypothetical protein